MLCTAPRSGHTAEHNITPAEPTIRSGVMPGQRRLVPAPHRPSNTIHPETSGASGRSDGCPASTWPTDTPASRKHSTIRSGGNVVMHRIANGPAGPQGEEKADKEKRLLETKERSGFTAALPREAHATTAGRPGQETRRPYAVVTRVHGGGHRAPTAHSTIWIHGARVISSSVNYTRKTRAPCPSHQGNVRTGNVPPAPTTRVSPSPSRTPATSSGEILAARTCQNLSGPRRATSTNQSKV